MSNDGTAHSPLQTASLYYTIIYYKKDTLFLFREFKDTTNSLANPTKLSNVLELRLLALMSASTHWL